MANPEHVKLVRQGKKAISHWWKEHPRKCLNLRGANLSQLNLVKADLRFADLERADLSDANLRGADLSNASLVNDNIRYADLSGTNLSEALLLGGNLDLCDLTGSNLTKADLRHANLSGASLVAADLTQAKCDFTVFANCNLHYAHGLETVEHSSPSSIGIDTLMVSFRAAGNKLTPELGAFFIGAGVPKELLAGLPGILTEIRYCTCFICYGEPDRAFAQKLCQDMESMGVSCWLYSMDAIPGKRTWREIGQKRREADKMVVLCSVAALVRDGVLKEIEEQIDEDSDKMVPVSLDNLWKEPGFRVMRGNRDLKPFLLERNYADFSGAMPYEEALERLLKELERRKSCPSPK